MSYPNELTDDHGLQSMRGPKWSPNAYPLLEIAKDAVHGHAMIVEKIREHAEAVAAERDQLRADRGAAIAANASVAGPGA